MTAFTEGQARSLLRPWAARWCSAMLAARPSERREWLRRFTDDTILPDTEGLPEAFADDVNAVEDALCALHDRLAEGAAASVIDRAAYRVGAAWATLAPPRHLGGEVADA